MTREDLKGMQSWSLQRKIQVTQLRIMEWYEHYNGQVYVSFSGGKDSTVLLDLARRAYPDIEAVFVDTGLEYPEIRQFVKTKENVTILRPKMRFDEVIKKYGWNYPSKDVSLYLYYAKHSKNNKQNYINTLNGLNHDGTPSIFKERYKKFAYLLDAPFPISNKCCLIMKESPLNQHAVSTGKKAIIGTLAEESQRRTDSWIKTGCNAFDSKIATSQPLSFWTEQNILQYIKQFEIPYCSVYGEIVEENNQESLFESKLHCTGEQRTGCMFCPVGCHLDHPNKYERMKITHPKQYDYCINNLGLGEVLDYIGVKY